MEGSTPSLSVKYWQLLRTEHFTQETNVIKFKEKQEIDGKVTHTINTHVLNFPYL